MFSASNLTQLVVFEQTNGGAIIKKRKIGNFEKSSVIVIGFGQYCSEYRKFLERQKFDVYKPELICRSIMVGNLDPSDKHVLVDWERWSKSNTTFYKYFAILLV